MPNYKGHLAGGALAYGFVMVVITQWYQPSLVTNIEWLFCTLAGALFPDIDVKSKGQKYFYWVILFLIIWFSFNKRFDLLIAASICAVIPMLATHRGLFHRLWFVVVGPLLLWALVMINYPLYRLVLLHDVIFFIAGAISHLWLDVGLRKMLRRI